MDAIDTLEFEEGFAPLTEDTDMFFGAGHIHGVEAVKAFFVRGEVTMAKKSEPDRVVRAPFTHIFYLAEEDPVRVRELRVTAGPLQADAVM
ncbi:hypothetical protein [Streptomyces chrestomyceticus]|uniref:hypothetical protein n=1 Tax=Streptomyces chrestomyceticus TaxID=68185 RepID=UPI0037B11CEF